MTKQLLRLPPFTSERELRVVVEAPRGCGLKLKLDAALGLFAVARALPAGLSYPYDWGFIPGTRGPDGDPLDALALHDHASYPGVVIPCRLIGMLVIDQRGEGGLREENNRFIAVPMSNERLADIRDVAALPTQLQEEIQQFFLNTTFHTGKDARARGWETARRALQCVRRAAVRK